LSVYDYPVFEPQKHQDAMNLDQIKQLDGQLKPADVDRLHWLGTQVPPHGIAVEIGPYKGKSTAAILSGMPRTAVLVAVDPWCLLGESKYGSYEVMNCFRDQIHPWQQQVIQIVGWPVDVAAFWHRPIDLLSVDSIKDYPRLSAIWRAWLPFCRGWIASHDYHDDPQHPQYYPGVHQTLNEIVKPVTTDHHWQEHSYTWSGRIR